MDGPEAPAGRCYRCLRPRRLCYCASVPTVEARTKVVILQHPHEAKHPFGSARLVKLCMPHTELKVVHGGFDEVLSCHVELPPDAAVLYPHRDAVDLAELPPGERPSTLVVLDGTWAHAKKLYRDNAWLASHRHVRLHPAEPSRYRIRTEPQEDYVSTLEAIAGALRILEPDNARVDRLVEAFDRMIDLQLAQLDKAGRHGRKKRERLRLPRKLPELLWHPGLVVAYAESSLPGGEPDADRQLVQWVAARVDTDEVFEALIRPAAGLPTPARLAHMGLAAAQLEEGMTPDAARAAFEAFAGSDAPLAAWTRTACEWGAAVAGTHRGFVPLKTGYCNLRNMRASYLETVVEREGLTPPVLPVQGRAAARLANALAVARWLRSHREAAALSDAGP